MEQEEPTDVLYDFLYRDSNRVASYYAQAFGGRLSLLEETDSRTEGQDKSLRVGSVHVAAAEGKLLNSTQRQSKRSVDPHDLIAADIMSHLWEGGHVYSDIEKAPHGSLIMAQGTLVFVDKSMAMFAQMGVDMIVAEELAKPKHQQNKESLQTYKFIKQLMQESVIPSAFLLQMKNGRRVAGTLKESGMEEPISNYYFKHGAGGLADVYVIGLKEVASPSLNLPETQMFGAMQQASQALSNMIFPPNACRVTPIALFRRFDVHRENNSMQTSN